jgi:undecaprenyl-diphosphatase
MSYVHAVVLGLIQGITEFLPISSSAHLVLAPHLFGWRDQGLDFDIATNTGTLLAVIVFFRHELVTLTRAGLASLTPAGRAEGRMPGRRLSPDARLAWLVALGTVPVAVAGLLAYHWVATVARNPLLIAATSIGFGLLLWWADAAGSRRRGVEDVDLVDTVVVGLAQALALIPGTSRSGITITAGLGRGLTREDAARFSFLLYVPVAVLAAAKELLDLVQGGAPGVGLGPLLVGFAVAAGSAYLTIGALLAWVQRRSLTVFVVYRVLLGVAILLAVWI